MMAKKEPVNLIPRPVDALAAQGANLWALACGLEALSRREKSDAAFSMRDFAVERRRGKHCRTVRCALGYAPVLGIAVKAYHTLAGPEFNYYDYSRRMLFGSGLGDQICAWAWCFNACWEKRDNTMTGAAQRIGFLVCHLDTVMDIRPQDLRNADALVERLHKECYAPGTLFDRWRQQVDWSVTPEIPGAREIAESAVEHANTIQIHE